MIELKSKYNEIGKPCKRCGRTITNETVYSILDCEWCVYDEEEKEE